MKRNTCLTTQVVCMGVLIGALCSGVAWGENIDPANDGSQFAWGENVGWINAEPIGEGGPGIEVTDTDLTGYMWGETIGWISLSCVNTSCSMGDFGVLNDGAGALSGFAWGENVGWINIAPTGGGVTIDPETGRFSGKAWGETIGWINFDVMDMGGVGITTSWRPMTAGDPLTLAVSLAGTRRGQVTSVPGGIACEADCSEDYPKGTQVTLTAFPDSGSTFVGWSGVECPGTGSCTFVMEVSGKVIATFESLGMPPDANLPDLTGTVTKFKHRVKAAGNKVVMKVSVTNRGMIVPSTPVMVSLHLSDDAVRDAGDLLLTEQEIDTTTLAPGEATPVKLKIGDLPPVDGKFALLSIDDQDTVIESNEANNMLVQQIGGRDCAKDVLLLEKEPNNAVSEAQTGAGKMKPGSCVTISGRVETNVDVDRYRVVVKEDQTMSATATHVSDVNVDLRFFDVEAGDFVEVCAAPASPERCTVTLSGIVGTRALDVVVMPSSGSGDYRLDLVSTP